MSHPPTRSSGNRPILRINFVELSAFSARISYDYGVVPVSHESKIRIKR